MAATSAVMAAGPLTPAAFLVGAAVVEAAGLAEVVPLAAPAALELVSPALARLLLPPDDAGALANVARVLPLAGAGAGVVEAAGADEP